MNKIEQQLDTGHLNSDLGRRAAQGGAFLIGVQAISFVTNIASVAVLARILTPADFGLIAMAAITVTLAKRIRSLGLTTATIQNKNVSYRQISALFWINVGIAAGLAILISAGSPLIAWFYGDSRLVGVTIGLAIALFISGLGVQHGAVLQRQMRFRIIAARQIAGAVVGPTAAITAALLGAGYWSLVILVLAESVVMTGSSFMFSRWIPGRIIRNANIGSMVKFGTHVSLSNIAALFESRMDNVLIGRIMGAASLGLYSKAYGLLLLPLIHLNTPITRTVVPTLSRLQDDPVRYKRYYYRAVTLIASLTMPVVAVFLVTSEEMVLTVLGDNWTEVSSLFVILAPAAFITALLSATTWAYVSLGNVSRQSRWSLFSAIVMVTAISIGTIWGLNGVAISVSVGRVVLFYPAMFTCYRHTQLSLREYHKALGRPIVSTLVAAGLSYGAGLLIDPGSSYLMLIMRMAIFGTVYMAVWLGIPGGTTIVREMRAMILRGNRTASQVTA